MAACSGSGSPTGAPVQPTSNAVRRVEQARRRPGGQQVVSARLTPRPIEVDLGGRIVSTLEGGYHLSALAECSVAHAGALLV